jgi:uncharacterized protein YdeI (YjbR/CyaY-like superfamily)
VAWRDVFDELEKIEVTSAEALRSWLAEHHDRDEAVALVTYKKVVRARYVSTDEVLDELLCFGWIDGGRCKLDDERTMQLISPRRTQHWTKSYKDRAARLEKEGRMQPPGREAIAQSKRLGLWSFMDDVDALVVPDDLARALDAASGARGRFDRSAPSYRRNVLRWIKLAKTAATRQQRVARAADFASRGEKLPHM